MATVKRDSELKTETVTKTVPVVRLTLSIPEAEALHAVMRGVGGDRKAGREHADSLLAGLSNAGINSRGKVYAEGALYFKPKSADPFSFSSFAVPVRPF